MAKKKADEDDEVVRPGFFRRLYHVFTTLLIIVVILYVVVLCISRTAGFRNLLEGELEKRLDMPMKIEKAQADFRFNLKLENVATVGFDEGAAGVKAGRVFLRWRAGWGFFPEEVFVENVKVVFTNSLGGGWAPPVLASVSSWLSKWLQMDLTQGASDEVVSVGAAAGAVSGQITDSRVSMFNKVHFSLKNGAMVWRSEGREMAALDGLFLEITPFSAPTREMSHYYLKLDIARGVGGLVWRDLNLELLDVGDQQIVLVCRAEQGKTIQ